MRVYSFKHPGIASVFRPNDGMPGEGNTSSSEISIQIGIFT